MILRIAAILITFTVLSFNFQANAADLDYARWSQKIMPLKVYIDQGAKTTDFNSSYPIAVANALKQWKTDTHNVIDFTITKNKNDADIIVTWSHKLKKSDFNNQVKGHGYAWGITKLGNPTEIVLVTKHPLNDQTNLTDNNIYMIALHELGHAIGMWWHTREPSDIMFADFIVPSTSSNGTKIIINKNKGELSQRDINNVRSLYNKDEVIILDKLAKGTNIKLQMANTISDISPVETTGVAAASVSTQLNDLNIDYGKSLTYLKEHPDRPEAHNNLGLYYLNQGELNKAIELFNTAIKVSPNYAQGHFNKALTASKLNNNTLAVLHYEKYIQIEPNSPEADLVKKELERLNKLIEKENDK